MVRPSSTEQWIAGCHHQVAAWNATERPTILADAAKIGRQNASFGPARHKHLQTQELPTQEVQTCANKAANPLPSRTGQGAESDARALLVMSLYPETENAELLSWSKQGKVLKKCSREEKEQL